MVGVDGWCLKESTFWRGRLSRVKAQGRSALVHGEPTVQVWGDLGGEQLPPELG